MMADIDKFVRLLEIVSRLRSNDGCSWDRLQSPESLKPHLLEECYELIDAIDQRDKQAICSELGDLLLQVVLQAQIFSERGEFSFYDVADSICEKLIRRHPQVFNMDCIEVVHQWEIVKNNERLEMGLSSKLSDRIPMTLPALKYSSKFYDNTNTCDTIKQLWSVRNIASMVAEIIDGVSCHAESDLEQIGELLFAISGLAHSRGVDAEDALRKTTRKRIKEHDRLL